MDEALRCAALAARQQYAMAGLSMPVWRDDRVVLIPPDQLDVNDTETDVDRPDSAQETGGSSGT